MLFLLAHFSASSWSRSQVGEDGESMTTLGFSSCAVNTIPAGVLQILKATHWHAADWTALIERLNKWHPLINLVFLMFSVRYSRDSFYNAIESLVKL